MELKMRYGKAYKDGNYEGKVMCNNQESFEKWLEDTKHYEKDEITEDEYNSLS
jgi:hypothetical protein